MIIVVVLKNKNKIKGLEKFLLEQLAVTKIPFIRNGRSDIIRIKVPRSDRGERISFLWKKSWSGVIWNLSKFHSVDLTP